MYEACRCNLVAANDEENALMRKSRAEHFEDQRTYLQARLALLLQPDASLPASLVM